MKLTIKQLIKELQDLTAAHNQVKSFEYGDFLTILKRKVDYTCVMANVSNATYRQGSNLINLQLNLFVADKTLKGDENKIDVESNTQQILNDLLGVITRSARWQEFGYVTTDIPEQKYYDRTPDVVTGWNATISLEIIHKNGFCDVPIFNYDYDQTSDDGCTILVTVVNSDSDTLATKVVSSSDSSVLVPDITFTDSDGVPSSVASGVNITATPCSTTIQANLNFIGTAEQSNIIFQASGVTTFTSVDSSADVGSITISTDDVTFVAFTLPFTPVAGTPYYFKRSTFLVDGYYNITD